MKASSKANFILFIFYFPFLAVLFWSCQPNIISQTDAPPIFFPTPDTIIKPYQFGPYSIPSSNPQTKEGFVLGRKLFYEKNLSLDNSISCASCHLQTLAFTDGKAKSMGFANRIGFRNAMSLANLVWQDSTFFWDGRAKSLEDQIHFPISDSLEMNTNLDAVALKLQSTDTYPHLFFAAFGTTSITGILITKALAQFERKLVSNNSRYDKSLTGKYTLTAQEQNGKNLFYTHPIASLKLRGGNCSDCHAGVRQTDIQFRNNGLDNIFLDNGRGNITQKTTDMGKFRVPTLRNIALTAPYMHDGRFTTLEEVLDHYNEHITKSTGLDNLISTASNNLSGIGLGLTSQEKKDIISFLKTLTDSTFITNPDFSNPN
jgi:cytochrome c peroxidase